MRHSSFALEYEAESCLMLLRRFRDMGDVASLRHYSTQFSKLMAASEDAAKHQELESLRAVSTRMEEFEMEKGVGSCLRLDHPDTLALLAANNGVITTEMISNAKACQGDYFLLDLASASRSAQAYAAE